MKGLSTMGALRGCNNAGKYKQPLASLFPGSFLLNSVCKTTKISRGRKKITSEE